jgi:serine/threonine protein phosphatase PrpC
MSDQAAADTVLEEGDLQLAAKKLVGKALRDGSTDNLSVILVQF